MAPTGLVNQGDGAEVRWDVARLGLLPGHTYRLYFMVHDGDQNKAGGDAGQGCATVNLNGGEPSSDCGITPPPTGGECPFSHGYWKKHTSEWPAGYTPNQKLGSVFTGLDSSTANKTLAEALDGKAGANNDVKNLLKQAVAGLLNAATANIKYPFTEAELIQAVNMALASGKTAQTSLATLLDEANNDKNCNQPPSGGGNCTTDGKPNVLLLKYNGQSCAEAFNSQMAIAGKTSCSGDPADAPVVRVVASTSSTPPAAGSAKFFDGLVNLNQNFEVRASNAGTSSFGSNTYLHIYNGTALVQTIQLHTSCSAPLIRGETFGSLVLVDYSIAP